MKTAPQLLSESCSYKILRWSNLRFDARSETNRDVERWTAEPKNEHDFHISRHILILRTPKVINIIGTNFSIVNFYFATLRNAMRRCRTALTAVSTKFRYCML